MKHPPSNPSLKACITESLEILSTAVEFYHQGRRSFYRIAALQLRLLLCDTTRRHNKIVEISLLSQAKSNLLLPPIREDGSPDLNAPYLPLPAWLAQPLPAAKHLDIRLFIRRICEQDGGAHFDPKPESGVFDIPQRDEWIIHIARIVLATLHCDCLD